MIMAQPEGSAPESPAHPTLAYDELRDRDGSIRPHWRPYFEYLDSIGVAEAKLRWTKAKQLLQENGASYDTHGDQSSAERPWRLSPIPLMISPSDWQMLARGIAQRARLFNCLIADIYGPQRTLLDGDLPSELVFDNPRFLRAIHGQILPRNHWLPIYGVELIRCPDGQFRAIEDLTQAPAGMGYALENRVVVAQTLPDLIRHCNIERFVSFFRLFGERLQDAAPHNRDAPRVALLTPGPFSTTYFEQAYLAKHLGIALVQGEDLAVRNDRVYLKTLGGLQPVDVLLRRVFDDYCDPLELRPESQLGVPGFVQAARAGNVIALNPLGTGVVETPAVLGYLPQICRKLLREELLLASVPTYYFGDRAQASQALDEFEHMVVKPTHPVRSTGSLFVHQLNTAERHQLRQQIEAAPQQFVAQRFIPSSRTPVVAEGELRNRACVLRCFANANQPNDYQIMPGGLALVAPNDSDVAVSIRMGARSKDVWVVSEEPINEGTIVSAPNLSVELSRGGGDLPSRVADNLYWLGRYTERAEAIGRLARVVGTRLLELPSERDTKRNAVCSRLLLALRCHQLNLLTQPIPEEREFDEDTAESEFVTAVCDANFNGSVVNALRSALRVSRVVRDRVSYDTWRVLSSLDEMITRLAAESSHRDLSRLTDELNRVIVTLAGFSGLVMESMTRGFAWRFLDMGRRMERAVSLVLLLRSTLVEPSTREAALIEAVLDVADSGMTYRRRYPAGLQTAPAVDLLLADETNPRGVIFQLKTLAQHIAALPPISIQGVRSNQERIVLSATSQIELADLDSLCQIGATTNRRSGLELILGSLTTLLPRLSDSLSETYLYHANVARHLRNRDSPSVSPGASK
jgi:uncharacterized circularly permuted ATP-grasp superfamily protein/uncharacterized alpha-E superfamily protein